MNLAITLLVAVAIASIIGTVLQQNQPYQDYIIKFGPFWFEMFERLGLYDVYSAGWFLFILGFLLVSTSVCVYRNTPAMLREMRQFRLNAQERSLKAMRNSHQLQVAAGADAVAAQAAVHLQNHGYRVRQQRKDGVLTVAAMKGGWNRLGYIFTHVAIVVICIGGLIDGNLGLKLKELRGLIEIETRDVPASQVPPISRLRPQDSVSFRGNVTIPEGAIANLVFLNVRDGYLVQELPFAIELKEFRIEHWPNGQPKSFESDLIIHDSDLDEPMHHTIAVNHPLVYKGYAIYQASFGDGGSRLNLQAWPLDGSAPVAVELEGVVNRNLAVQMPDGPVTLEFSDFQRFNIFPAAEDDPQGRKFQNYGPSFTFRMRNAAGEAREYVNYMSPVVQDGRYFFISGMRATQADEFRYLHIPADRRGTVDRFLRYRALLADEQRVAEVARRHALESMAGANMDSDGFLRDISSSMTRLVGMFSRGGFDEVVTQVEATVPEDRQQDVITAYFRVLETTLQALYVEVLREEGIEVAEVGVSDEDAFFFEDALNAMAGLPFYGSPVYFQLAGFEQVEASGLQITRSPGIGTVYTGSVMLIVGVFLLFYVAHRRLWVRVEGDGADTRLLFAGTGNRNPNDFTREFEGLRTGLEARLRRLEQG